RFRLRSGVIPPPRSRLVARADATRAAADNLLLHRLQPDPMDQAFDSGGARHRLQWLFHCHGSTLLVGKAVLVTDSLPFMRRFEGAPLIQPILFKGAIYWLCVLIGRLAEGLVHSLADGRRDIRSWPGRTFEHRTGTAEFDHEPT